MRWRARVAYDGSEFVGWQTQSGNGRTVQEELEKALSTVLRGAIRVRGSGRTDTGVHARGQVVAFDSDTKIDDPRRTAYSLNSILPRSIVISEIESVSADFDPRRDAVHRTYRYRILNVETPSPFEVNRAWHVREFLDLDAMRTAADQILGHHDFASFQTSDNIDRPSERDVLSASVAREGDIVTFEITANAFCRGMVRNLAGQLVEIGRGRAPAEGMSVLLAACDRGKAAAAAPPHGLYLEEVSYG